MPDQPATLADRFRSLLKRLGFDGYDTAKHYMRGPGPKSRALQQSDRPPDEQTGSGRGEKRLDEQSR